MKKITLKLFIAMFILIAGQQANAQLSERVNNPSTFRLGTRPVQGNWGFSIAYTYNELDSMMKDATIESSIPLIGIKYYISDDLALNFSVKTYKKSTTYSGDIDADNDLASRNHYENKDVTVKNYIMVGVEKHFLASNVLDPYFGANVILGYYRETKGSLTEYSNGDKSGAMKSRFSMLYGYELFIGVQAFIADLPLSIGAEAGITGYGLTSDKYKTESTNTVAGVQNDVTYYTANADNGPIQTQFSSLSASRYVGASLIRFKLNYYFK